MVEQTSPAPSGAPVGGSLPPEAAMQGTPEGAPQEAAPTIQSLFASMSGSGETTSTARTVNRNR